MSALRTSTMSALFTDKTNAINRALAIIGLLYLGLVAAALAGQNPDDVKQQILSQAQSISADDYAFTRTVRAEQTTSGKTEKQVNVETFDPRKPAEARWTLVSVNGASPAAEELKGFLKESAQRPVPGYYRLAGYFGSPAAVSTDASGGTLFHFTALPKNTVKVMNTDVSHNCTADVSVREEKGIPVAEQMHVSVKPMRLKLLMKLERYESTARYRIGPEGKPFLVEQTSDMSGSGMGQEGRAHTVVTYSDYRFVGGQR